MAWQKSSENTEGIAKLMTPGGQLFFLLESYRATKMIYLELVWLFPTGNRFVSCYYNKLFTLQSVQITVYWVLWGFEDVFVQVVI